MILALLACDRFAEPVGCDATADADFDGYVRCADDPAYRDCNDLDPRIHPFAAEVCDGLDNDCSGTLPAHEQDLDGDGQLACAGDCDDADEALQDWDADGDGWTTCEGDCDDARAAVHPVVEGDCDDRDPARPCELCDGLDDDCDGVIPADERDEDADGQASCAGDCDDADPTLDGLDHDDDLQSSCNGDCDDHDPARSVGALEWCDDVDDDCDGFVDEAGSLDAPAWYADRDGDQYGDAAAPTWACDRPDDHVADATDCDDGAAATNPGRGERCDGVDEDCDGVVDDGAVAGTWYTDADADGYGDPTAPSSGCSAAPGTVTDASDCDDTSADVHPDATETCDARDEDCDGTTDESAPDAPVWYADADGDGWGTTATPSCSAPSGYTAYEGDCDDTNAAVNPDAEEGCNDGVDSNCGGVADPGGFCAEVVSSGGVTGARPDTMAVGDTDTDGAAELLIGASSADTVWLFAGAQLTTSNTCSEWIGPTGSETGGAVAVADLDGDGTPDTAGVGGPAADGDHLWGGRVWFVDPAATDLEDGERIDGADDRLGFGAAIAVGYVDGDTLPDRVIGAHCCGGAQLSGGVYVFTGAAATSDDAAFVVEDPGIGESVAVGDLDGDGYGDIVAGVPGDDTSAEDAGAAWIIWGGETVVGTALLGLDADGALGSTVAIDDTDGDGLADLVLGAPGGPGEVWVYLGARLAPGAVPDRILRGAASDHAGAGLAVGDLDGDTTPDLAIAGSAVWFSLDPAGDVDLASADGRWNADGIGAPIARLGDTDGDGFIEIAAGTDDGFDWFEGER